jgi:hypothetical protein
MHEMYDTSELARQTAVAPACISAHGFVLTAKAVLVSSSARLSGTHVLQTLRTQQTVTFTANLHSVYI